MPFHPSHIPQLPTSITRFLSAERNYSFQGSRLCLHKHIATDTMPSCSQHISQLSSFTPASTFPTCLASICNSPLPLNVESYPSVPIPLFLSFSSHCWTHLASFPIKNNHHHQTNIHFCPFHLFIASLENYPRPTVYILHSH